MTTSFQVKTVATKPFAGQKPGTSGLRKKVAEVVKEHYLENFVQCIFESVPELVGGVLILGGDGRYDRLLFLQFLLYVIVYLS
jgi:phosphoglucomutase